MAMTREKIWCRWRHCRREKEERSFKTGRRYCYSGIKMRFLLLRIGLLRRVLTVKVSSMLRSLRKVLGTLGKISVVYSWDNREIGECYPNNPIRRALTPALRSLFVYPVKTNDENIDISMGDAAKSTASAEIVFSGKAQPGVTAADVNVDEIRMVVGESLEGFGFTGKNELINGKAAVIGFLLLLDFELLTGKGLLKGTGFLDFIHSVSAAFK
ncbi:hypothetical protein Ancab_037320 [Ancistrocladus abbreviatus]